MRKEKGGETNDNTRRGKHARVSGRYRRGIAYMLGSKRMHVGSHRRQIPPEVYQSPLPASWPAFAMTIHARMVGTPLKRDEMPWFPEWTVAANCLHEDPEIFFPQSWSNRASRQAKRICQDCPVRLQCLTDNLDVPFGIFGGLDERERWKLRGLQGDPHRDGLGFFTEHYRTMVREERGYG